MIRALNGILPNLKGPREKKRQQLYANAVNCIINYGAPIWSDTTSNRKIGDLLRRIQRVLAIRVISGYRTISADAVLLLARIVPTPIYAAYYQRVFLRSYDLKRQDKWNPLVEKEIKKKEEILLRRQWKLYLQRRDAAGARTCNAILPVFDMWLDRRHGELVSHNTTLYRTWVLLHLVAPYRQSRVESVPLLHGRGGLSGAYLAEM